MTLNQRAVGSTPTRPTKFFNHLRILSLDYVYLVPSLGANFFQWRVQQVHKSLCIGGEPLRIVIQRRRGFAVAEHFADIEQRHVTGEQE